MGTKGGGASSKKDMLLFKEGVESPWKGEKKKGGEIERATDQ
jgi:hypothetical protein